MIFCNIDIVFPKKIPNWILLTQLLTSGLCAIIDNECELSLVKNKPHQQSLFLSY